MEIGKVILEQRGRLNLSQRALAEKAGIRQATLSSIESGCDVKIATARRVLLALGMDLAAVPAPRTEKDLAAKRAIAIKRVRDHFRKRRILLGSLIEGLSASQIRHVREINAITNTGYLAELWDQFLRLDKAPMKRALRDERFKGMAWQCLLQANPFIVARVGTWDQSPSQ